MVEKSIGKKTPIKSPLRFWWSIFQFVTIYILVGFEFKVEQTHFHFILFEWTTVREILLNIQLGPTRIQDLKLLNSTTKTEGLKNPLTFYDLRLTPDWPQNDRCTKLLSVPLLGLEHEIRNFDMTNLSKLFGHYIHVHDHDFNRGRTRSNLD